MPDKDHLAIAQRHLSSNDDGKYIRAQVHALLGIVQELRKLNEQVCRMTKILEQQGYFRER